MKTRINQLVVAAIFTFIFLVGNVNAKGTELFASGHENIEETALELENWMMNENYWNTNETFFYNVENEAAMEVESWMTNECNWEVDICSFVTETEPELALESWMTNESTWKQDKTIALETETETKLGLEHWMTSDLVWIR